MNMYKKIYFMGIKGVGMAPLALIAKEAGSIVGGSDVNEEFITDKILRDAKIEVQVGFDSKNVQDFFRGLPSSECLFIATGAHDGFDNVEAVFARNMGFRVISHGEAVGLFMEGEVFSRKDIEGISVSGSHGKTTITGMIASALTTLGLDPSFTVGTSEIFPQGAGGHYGAGRFFVAEADEYFSEPKYDRNPKFLYQKPKYLIINNIDYDHPDVYPNLESVARAYRQFALSLGEGSVLILNGDDEAGREIAEEVKVRVITYGTDSKNEFKIKNYRQNGFNSSFTVLRGETDLGIFSLSIPGYHNAKNALSVVALLVELGISFSDIKVALPQFLGVKRRLERVGKTKNGILIIDDYAHHPEEIRKSLEAISAAFKEKKIVLIFQAHTYERTKAMLSNFASSFTPVHELIILPTFASLRDQAEHDISEDQQFVDKIRMLEPNVKLIETKAGVVKYIDKNLTSSDFLIVTMGAGDVYKVASQLTNSL